MTSPKNKTKFQNSISKIKIFVLEFFPYSEVTYKTMTSLAAANRATVVLPN
jgi:hypothetical protein